MSRSPARSAVLALALIAAAGCKTKGEGEEAGAGQGEASAAEHARPELPRDEASFLALLLPLPDDVAALELHYRVEGPALEGEMDVALRPGGARRDRWELRSSAGDAMLRVSGSRVVTPDQIWSGPTGEAGELRPNHLGGLARAYLARDADAQAKIVAAISAWHATLAEQRARASGEQAEVLGVACLRTRIAGQNVCMWEEAGVLLDYEGSAFSIEAEQIDRAPELADDTFELPAISSQADKLDAQPPDYDAVLDELAAGSYATLSQLIYANIALPELQ